MTADPISCALSAPCATVPGVTCDPTDWGKRVFPAPRAAGGPPDHHGPQYGLKLTQPEKDTIVMDRGSAAWPPNAHLHAVPDTEPDGVSRG